MANIPPRGHGFDKHPENISKKGGTAKAWSWKGLIEWALEEEDETGTPAKVLVVKKLVNKAKIGDHRAIDTVMDRTEGKPKQTIEIDSPEERWKKYYDELKRVQDTHKDVPSK